MSRLHELIRERLHVWPEGIECICVSRKKSQWMLKCKHPAETVCEQIQRTFQALGPCSYLYRHQSCTEQQFREIAQERAKQEA